MLLLDSRTSETWGQNSPMKIIGYLGLFQILPHQVPNSTGQWIHISLTLFCWWCSYRNCSHWLSHPLVAAVPAELWLSKTCLHVQVVSFTCTPDNPSLLPHFLCSLLCALSEVPFSSMQCLLNFLHVGMDYSCALRRLTLQISEFSWFTLLSRAVFHGFMMKRSLNKPKVAFFEYQGL